jgi:alpha-tubulin suppressor-like RCC1 family protein
MAFKSSLFPSGIQVLGDKYSNNYTVGSDYYSQLDEYVGGDIWRWGANGIIAEHTPYQDTANGFSYLSDDWANVQMSDGDEVIAIKTNNTVWRWKWPISSTYAQVVNYVFTNSFKQVYAGTSHFLALTKNGRLLGWGNNSSGQLGNGSTGSNVLYTNLQYFIPNMSGPYEVLEAAAGSNHTLAIVQPTFTTAYGSANTQGERILWATGENLFGGLGTNDTIFRSIPVAIGSINNWKSVFCNKTPNSFAIKTDGTAWAWGYNEYGELGLNDTVNRSSPTQIGLPYEWAFFSPGATGVSNHGSYGIKGNGTLWAWGYNVYGSLGVNDTVNRSSPVQIGTSTDWRTVKGSSGAGFGIKTDGSLWAWGNNNFKQLGHSDITVHRSSPTQIPGLVDYKWKSVSGSWIAGLYGRVQAIRLL